MTTDELRAKFEEWYPNAIGDVQPFECYLKGYASRDAEVEALQDALFQISVRLKAEREPGMDDMSWHTDMMARAQYLANVEAEAEMQRQRIESAPVGEVSLDERGCPTISCDLEEGKRMRLVVDED